MSHGDYDQTTSSDGSPESTDGGEEGEGDVEQLFHMEASGEFAHLLHDSGFSGSKNVVQKSLKSSEEGAPQSEASPRGEGKRQPLCFCCVWSGFHYVVCMCIGARLAEYQDSDGSDCPAEAHQSPPKAGRYSQHAAVCTHPVCI